MIALLALGLFMSRDARAEGASVPLKLQAGLLAKVAKYDKHMAARAHGTLRVLVLYRKGDGVSERASQHLERYLRELRSIGGFPQEVIRSEYTTADELVAAVRDEHAAIVYLTPGLGSSVAAIVRALDGIDVLSVSAVPEHVERGIVLGFDLKASKPILLVNLPAARRQNVAFDPKVLKLMKVYR